MRKGRDKKEEVEYKSKSGTAWSHSYLNQKPWHPLSYPNQRRKWIAEQTHAEHQRRSEEVSREFAQEQDFFRTSALLSKKEREKIEVMQAVSFMYMRPPGYNAESARAAEIAEEKKAGEDISNADTVDQNIFEGKKTRVKDLYGRAVPTEEEFPVLKNAPRMESGVSARVKPFAVEIRNVKCARCGTFGHQSGDRECPLKDSITTNEVARQKRDDPLTSIMSVVTDEPLKWELKHKPGGLSPPRGGFQKDDPNQQIIPEDIYDEYGGFLAGGAQVQDLLASLSNMKHKKKKHRKHKSHFSPSDSNRESDSERECRRRSKHKVKKKRKHDSSESDTCSDSRHRQRRQKHKDKRFKREFQSNSSCSDTDPIQRERRNKRKMFVLDNTNQSLSDMSPQNDRRHRRDKNHREKRRKEREVKEKEGHSRAHHSKNLID